MLKMSKIYWKLGLLSAKRNTMFFGFTTTTRTSPVNCSLLTWGWGLFTQKTTQISWHDQIWHITNLPALSNLLKHPSDYGQTVFLTPESERKYQHWQSSSSIPWALGKLKRCCWKTSVLVRLRTNIAGPCAWHEVLYIQLYMYDLWMVSRRPSIWTK